MVINMKMNLKNRSFKKISNLNIKLTSKNLFIFLISFSIVTFIIGIIFYYILNSSDKTEFNNGIINYFTLKDNYNYLDLLKSSFLENTFNSFLIWILGISVIGIIAVIFIYFCSLFSLGFSIASIFASYKAKGIIGTICYLFPSKACYLIVMFFLTFFAIKISYKIIKLCFTKEEINIKEEINRYFKVLLFSFFSLLAVSVLEVFVDPFIIGLFSKL